MTKSEPVPSKRTYSLGKRLEQSDQKRSDVLLAARKLLESKDFYLFTLDTLARDSGITRQTIHNLFRTKAGVLEALFDQIALGGGMDRMRSLMTQQIDPGTTLSSFVQIFTDFWSRDRLIIRRIHGIAAIDSDLGGAVDARNDRRRFLISRLVDQLDRVSLSTRASGHPQRAAMLHALTGFEFFDTLAQGSTTEEQATEIILTLVKQAFTIS